MSEVFKTVEIKMKDINHDNELIQSTSCHYMNRYEFNNHNKQNANDAWGFQAG